MKSFVLAVAALLTAIAHSAAAAEPWAESPRDSAVMLYFSKSFGHQRSGGIPPAFGLRLERQLSQDWQRPVALFDARYSLGGRQQFLIGGLNAFDTGSSGAESSAASGDFSRKHPGWTAAMIVGAVLAGMCIADWCRDDDRYDGEGTQDPPPQGDN